MRLNKFFTKDRLLHIGAVLFWLLVWQGASMLFDEPLLLVSPLRVLRQLFALLGQSAFYSAVWFSLSRIALGFLLGVAAGVLFAIAAAHSRAVETLLHPLMVTVKSVPVASFIILALVWLTSKKVSVFIVFLMVVPIVYSNLLSGLKSKSRELDEMARMYHIPFLQRLKYVELPQLRPALLSALSLSLGLSWKSGVAAEIIGVPRGSLGYALSQAKLYLDTAGLYAWTAAVVLLSVLFERLILYFVRRAFIRLESL